MKKTIFKITLLNVLLLAGVAVVFLVPAFAAQKGIKVIKVDEVVNWTNIDEPVWANAPVYEASLNTAPPFHPDTTSAAAVVALKVQAVQDKKNIYIKLNWQDRSNNTQIKGLNDFKDAVAVQFPISRSKTTNPFMGEKGKRVNIWRWAAGNVVENLFAEGFGTLTPSDTQYLKGSGVYHDGSWTVILSRSLSAPTAKDISVGKTMPVSFAVWEGGNGERDGFKAASIVWIDMMF
ncbi:MAG: hypothetical protein A2073_04415 [Deltaproteobacteria bacterium GWC2_42_11]|nr:MAG: hypothetical protein A2073_04415 [Deltaproteobacteria bacterium GWC2_42_11]